MSDHPAKLKKSSTPVKQQGGPLEGVLAAPIIWFDGVSFFGASPATNRIQLEAVVEDADENGQPIHRRVAVAHLRAGNGALAALRRAIDEIEKLRSPPDANVRPN